MLAELARLDQLADRDHRRAVEERVPRHEHEVLSLGELDELAASAERRRAASRRRRACRLRAPPCASSWWVETGVATSDRLDVGRPRAPRSTSVVCSTPGYRRPIQGEPSRDRVADGDELGVVELDEVADEVRAPVAEAHDSRSLTGARQRRRLPCRSSAKRVCRAAGDPGRTTSCARRRRPCRAPRRTSSARARSPARGR